VCSRVTHFTRLTGSGRVPSVFAVLRLSLIVGLAFAISAAPPPPDDWVTDYVRFPAAVATNSVRLAGFESLRAEPIAGRLKVTWQPAALDTNATVTAWASADAPGHWPARDWRPHSMRARGRQWEVSLPVENVDVPVVYFVESGHGTQTNASLMRIVHPRAAGMEEPSRIPWPFLEGFEQGLESWSLVGDDTFLPPLSVTGPGVNGEGALAVKLPGGKRSVTVATTRLRGWQIQQHFARAFSVWLRAPSGPAQARITLLANARTDEQVLAVAPALVELTGEWQRVELPFAQFPRLPLAEVDLLTIEFIGVGPAEFHLDDLELVGR
jgi:hypothetical protein